VWFIMKRLWGSKEGNVLFYEKSLKAGVDEI